MSRSLVKGVSIRLAAVVVIGLVIAVYFAGLAGDYELDAKSFSAEKLHFIEQQIGFALPEGSRGVNMFWRGSQRDPEFLAKIEIPSASEDALIEDIRRIEVVDAHGPELPERVRWWTYQKANWIIDREYDPNGNYVHLILSKEKEGLYLYVQWLSVG